MELIFLFYRLIEIQDSSEEEWSFLILNGVGVKADKYKSFCCHVI